MDEKYIRRNKESYNIVRNSKNYGKFKILEDAIFVRDILVDNNWDLNSINEIYIVDGKFLAVRVIAGKAHILEKSDTIIKLKDL